MSTIKVNIATMSEKNGWVNILTAEDKELSVLIKDGKNPKTKAVLDGASNGQTVELPAKITEKDGKSYVWDADDKKGGFGGKSFTPADKSFQAAQNASQAAATMLSLKKDPTEADFDKWFEHIHTKIMSKITPKS